MNNTLTETPHYTDVGFTGSRKEITRIQRSILQIFIENIKPKYFHHGDCVGADYAAHEIINHYIAFKVLVCIHPPDNPKSRAYCRGYEHISVPKTYLQRNYDIVTETQILIACPDTKEEKVRSGTWATIRTARKYKKKIIIIFPDGSVSIEGAE